MVLVLTIIKQKDPLFLIKINQGAIEELSSGMHALASTKGGVVSPTPRHKTQCNKTMTFGSYQAGGGTPK